MADVPGVPDYITYAQQCVIPAETCHLAVGENFYFGQALCGARADFYYKDVDTFLAITHTFPGVRACDECEAILLSVGLAVVELVRGS